MNPRHTGSALRISGLGLLHVGVRVTSDVQDNRRLTERVNNRVRMILFHLTLASSMSSTTKFVEHFPIHNLTSHSDHKESTSVFSLKPACLLV